jgi:hypothetical protein
MESGLSTGDGERAVGWWLLLVATSDVDAPSRAQPDLV